MKQISFCTTVCDRLGSLKKTLPVNLLAINDFCEICLVDFNSKSDPIAEWVEAQFSAELSNGSLRFFAVLDDVPWSAPHAKNLAHRLSTTPYMVNIDADNYLSKEDVRTFLAVARRGLPLQQELFDGVGGNGTCGRIGLSSETFYDLGGYDEGMLPMGFQDLDLLHRATKHKGARACIAWNDSTPLPVDNDVNKLQSFSDKSASLWSEINEFNIRRSALRERLMGIRISSSFASYKGDLNGKRVSVDGFGRI